MGDHADLVRGFIRSDASPDGKWWTEVPVGFSLEEDSRLSSGQLKYVDAVCLTSRPPEPPEVYPENDSFTKWVDPGGTGETKTELFRRLRDSGSFAGEHVQVVECKTGPSSFTGLGQLTAYEELVERDYGWDVQTKVLVSAERDPIVGSVSQAQDIRVVHVDS
jgi:hypothetical protein